MSGPYKPEQLLTHDNHHPYTLGCAICRDLMDEDLARELASPEPTPGLREAIEKFVGTAYPNNGEGHTDKLTWTVPERAFGDLRRALAASPVPEPDGETETCPTCWQPVPVPQRGDHDYGIPLAAPEPTGLDADGWVIKSASAERDFTNGDYTSIVVIYNDNADPGDRYRQGYGEGTTPDEAIRTAHSVALAARLTGEGS